MNGETVRHDSRFDSAMDTGERELRAPSTQPMADRCPWTFSSNSADAFWITAWSVYHSGKRPCALHKSKGHSWLADIPGVGITRLWVDRADHRDGIRIAPKGGAA